MTLCCVNQNKPEFPSTGKRYSGTDETFSDTDGTGFGTGEMCFGTGETCSSTGETCYLLFSVPGLPVHQLFQGQVGLRCRPARALPRSVGRDKGCCWAIAGLTLYGIGLNPGG